MHLSNIRLAFENINFIFASKINSNEVTANEIFFLMNTVDVTAYNFRKNNIHI